jgi:hypothetical protein
MTRFTICVAITAALALAPGMAEACKHKARHKSHHAAKVASTHQLSTYRAPVAPAPRIVYVDRPVYIREPVYVQEPVVVYERPRFACRETYASNRPVRYRESVRRQVWYASYGRRHGCRW